MCVARLFYLSMEGINMSGERKPRWNKEEGKATKTGEPERVGSQGTKTPRMPKDPVIQLVHSSGPHHQDSGEAKIRESTAGVSRKPSSDGKARGCSSKHLCGLTAWNT